MGIAVLFIANQNCYRSNIYNYSGPFIAAIITGSQEWLLQQYLQQVGIIIAAILTGSK